MKIIGLTGSIAMGKSHAAATFRRLRIPVFDADATVHALQAPNGAALPAIARAFPGTVTAGRLNRAALRAQALATPEARRRLEGILHPMVRAAQARFLARARAAGAPLAVLDIPLLFETGGDRLVDHIVVVSAPKSIQESRLRLRRTMSPAQIAAVLAHQTPDSEKRARADTVIRTGLSKRHAQLQIVRVIERLRRPGLCPGPAGAIGPQTP